MVTTLSTPILQKKSLNYLDPTANSNKFYTIELHDKDGIYEVYIEYGRVGKSSQQIDYNFSSLYQAESFFNKKIREKIKKGYVEIDLAQSATGTNEARALIDTSVMNIKTVPEIKSKSNLDPIIQSFVIQIYDEANNKLNSLVKGNYNSDGSCPLGKLSPYQIGKGRRLLQEISGLLSTDNKKEILDLSTEYYRQIPKSFGNKVTINSVLINSIDKISVEMDILKFYEDSLRMQTVMFDTVDIDKRYEALNSEIGLLLPSDPEFNRIVKYVNGTESKHHDISLKVKNIYSLNQKTAPQLTNKIDNIAELFHGSRSANMIGILSTHLRLPNQLKGVQITGAMFGPGIYFADQSTKSSQYSCSRFGSGSNKYKTAFMFLAEVALGKVKNEQHSNYYTKAPKGYDSVKGCKGPSLLHNEFIVYKENQQKLKYIVEFETHRRR